MLGGAMKRLTVIALLIALVGAACSTSGGDDSLTVYSGRSEDLVQPLIDRFVEETGIEVAVRYAGSSDLAATILEEGSSSPADLFFAQDPASLGTVALAGLFVELPSSITDMVPTRFSDTNGQWVGTSGRARVVVYDGTKVNPSDLPDTEDGFVEAEWSGRTGIAPTNGSFLAFVAAKILSDGEEATLVWLKGMAANSSPTYPKNSPIVAAVNAGEIETGLVNHYYLLRALAENPGEVGENFFFTVPTAGSLVMPAGAGILKSSGNQEAAQTFVECMLGDVAQTACAEEPCE
ncbi:MAG: iron ABC transporter substrate-binding protein [Actinobacteria bacterium]|nr:MAG: iron ABC transporter substrate-binding protein [Actinomycetota bacterium]